MFCPKCGINQSEELKFCKSCGANLVAVRQAVVMRETDEKFDWSKTWAAEMFLSSDEKKRREQERHYSLTAEEKRDKDIKKRDKEIKNRYNEIKAGVITSLVGISIMIFLHILMKGIILSGQNTAGDAEILSRIWVAGVIPFFVGLGLLINGLIVSKRLVEISERELQSKGVPKAVESSAKSKENLLLSSADWYEADSPRPSVTENTTRELRDTR